jgi:HlyD family secretion protein
MEQTRIKKASSEKDLDRAQQLFEANLLSRASFDQAKTEVEVIAQSVNVQASNLKQLAAQLSIARSVYEKSFFRAPFNGVVAEILVQEGEYLVLGIPVYDLYDDSSVYVTARFDETDAARLSPGMAARVKADALGKELHGVIESVAPVVDTDLKAGRGVDVKFSLKSAEPDIRIGMSVDVEVILAVKQEVAYLPTSVIQGSEGGRFVLLASKTNRVEKRPIATGISNWEKTEIVSGIDPNDRIISSVNLPDLKEGARVKIKS